MGGYRFFEEMFECLIGEDMYFDIFFFFGEVDIESLEEIFRKYGIDKILFVIDFFWKDQKREVEYVDSLRFFEEEKEKIFWKNVQWLFGFKIVYRVN